MESNRVGPLLGRSDSLRSFRDLLASLPPLKAVVGELIQVRLVIDACIVQSELRWRVRRRRDPNARSALQEAIDSGTVVALAPAALKREIENHIEDIAEDASVPVVRVREEWNTFQSRLNFYQPDEARHLSENCIDADDLPYDLVRSQLGAEAVYTRDGHFSTMRIPAITVNLDLTLRDYARASSTVVALKLGSGLMLMISVEGLAAALKAISAGFQRLPDLVKLLIGLAVVVAIARPKSRQKISNLCQTIRRQLLDPNSSFSNSIAPIASEFVAAQKVVNSTRLQIASALPPTRKTSALIHARAICVASDRPLSEAEIELRMRDQGYISSSPTFRAYLRRVLRTDQRFREVSPNIWVICREKIRAR